MGISVPCGKKTLMKGDVMVLDEKMIREAEDKAIETYNQQHQHLLDQLAKTEELLKKKVEDEAANIPTLEEWEKKIEEGVERMAARSTDEWDTFFYPSKRGDISEGYDQIVFLLALRKLIGKLERKLNV